MRRILFVALLGLVLASTRGAAQDPIFPVPVVAQPDDAVLPGPPPGRVSWIKACFQRHNCCCAAHHNDLGCTSGKADCKFIFGSCRTFFSQPCEQGPSPYRYVPPQSTKPPSRWWGGGCSSCQ
jgi:hypothetical protein